MQPADSHVINRFIDRLIESNRQSEAIQLASEYVSIHPLAPETYYRLANLYWSSGDRENTINALTDALRFDLNSDSFAYRYQSARLEYLQGNYSTAAKIIDDLVAEQPDDFAGLYLAGLIYSAQGDRLKAEKFLSSAIERNPEHLYVHVSLAAAYLKQNKYLQAAGEYQRAGILAADPSDYLNLLAGVYNQMGETCKETETLRINNLTGQGAVNLETEFQRMNAKCSH